MGRQRQEDFANYLDLSKAGAGLPKRPPVLHIAPPSFLTAPKPGFICPVLRFPGKAEQAPAGKGTADLVGWSPNPLQMG